MAKSTVNVDMEGNTLRPKVLVPTLAKLFEHRCPVLLKGSPGIGKTDMVTAAAEQAGFDLEVFHPVVSDPTDFKGMPAIVESGAEFLPFGDLRKLLEADKPTVAFLDDLGQAATAVQAAGMQLILAREINGKKISDFITFAAATNNKQDKAGVSGILEPVKSRFVTILGVTVSVDDWCEWAADHGVHPHVVSFLRFKPEMINKFEPTSDIKNSPCPRTIAHAAKLYEMFDDSDAAKWPVIEGAAGAGFATELQAYIKIFMSVPDPEKILADPDKYLKLDRQKPDISRAVALAVAERATRRNVGKFIYFVEQLGKQVGRDIAMLSLKSAAVRDRDLMKTREWADYVVENQDIAF